MKKLHSIIEETLQKKLTPDYILTKLIERKLSENGIKLGKKQLSEIKKYVERNHNTDGLISIPSRINKKVKLRLTLDDLEKFMDDMSEQVEGATQQIIKILVEKNFKRFKKSPRLVMKPYLSELKSFNKGIKKVWGESLDILKAYITVAYEAGRELNNSYRQEKSDENIHKKEVLLRLHARACQIASEVHTLLSAGYADGAHARWRSIHEIASVAIFIAHNADELSERYLLHEGVESYKAMNLYQKNYKKLGMKTLSKRKITSIQRQYNNLLKQFGSSFRGDYGWASNVLENPNPKFRDIEEAAGLDHLHSYYKMASHNVHANPKGILYKLGLLNNSQDLMLAGPSNVGFTDPAQCTALSLSQVTISLLLIEPEIEGLITSKLLLRIADEIGNSFYKAEVDIKKRENKIRKQG